MKPYDFLRAIRGGKCSQKGWAEIVAAIHRLKLGDKILEEIHLGLSKLPDRELKRFLDSL